MNDSLISNLYTAAESASLQSLDLLSGLLNGITVIFLVVLLGFLVSFVRETIFK
jgi:hypothetical protein